MADLSFGLSGLSGPELSALGGGMAGGLIAVPASLVGCVSAEDNSVIAPVSEGTDHDRASHDAPVTGQQIASLLLAGSEQFGQLADRLSQSNPDPSAVLSKIAQARSCISRMAVWWPWMPQKAWSSTKKASRC